MKSSRILVAGVLTAVGLPALHVMFPPVEGYEQDLTVSVRATEQLGDNLVRITYEYALPNGRNVLKSSVCEVEDGMYIGRLLDGNAGIITHTKIERDKLDGDKYPQCIPAL